MIDSYQKTISIQLPNWEVMIIGTTEGNVIPKSFIAYLEDGEGIIVLLIGKKLQWYMILFMSLAIYLDYLL